MKYIRTKDGIIDRDAVLPHMVVDGYIDFNSRGRFKIIKQADSIEELCDRFIVLTKNGNHPFTYPAAFEMWIETGEVEGIYGAIWTDKGLVYVAKMNEKGELKLI